MSSHCFSPRCAAISSLQIGETVVVAGAVQMLVSPLTNILARKLDLRIMLAIGMALFVVAVYLNAFMTNQDGLCRAVRAAGGARYRADVLLSAGQSDRAGHPAARAS